MFLNLARIKQETLDVQRKAIDLRRRADMLMPKRKGKISELELSKLQKSYQLIENEVDALLSEANPLITKVSQLEAYVTRIAQSLGWVDYASKIIKPVRLASDETDFPFKIAGWLITTGAIRYFAVRTHAWFLFGLSYLLIFCLSLFVTSCLLELAMVIALNRRIDSKFGICASIILAAIASIAFRIEIDRIISLIVMTAPGP